MHSGVQVATVIEVKDCVRLSGAFEGGNFQIEARYVVGADGARSVVRQQAGIAFPGTDCTSSYYFGDVRLTNAPHTGRFGMQNAAGGVEVIPIADGRSRVIFIDPSRYPVPVSTPVTLQEMQDGVRRIMSADTIVSDPIWLSRFGNESRLEGIRQIWLIDTVSICKPLFHKETESIKMVNFSPMCKLLKVDQFSKLIHKIPLLLTRSGKHPYHGGHT